MLLLFLFTTIVLVRAVPAPLNRFGSTTGSPFGSIISSEVSPTIFPISAPYQYYGGPIMTKVKLLLFLWGGKDRVQFSSELEFYYRNLVKSPWMEINSQYPDANGSLVQKGSFIGTFSDDSAPLGLISDLQVKSRLLNLIAAGKLPKHDKNTLYQIHGPVGTNFTYFGNPSCGGKFYAYHSSVESPEGNIIYSMVPSHSSNGCSAQRCNHVTSVADINDCVLKSQQLSGSHEVAEAILNPTYEIKPQNFPIVSPLFWGNVTNFGLYLQSWRRKCILGKFFQLESVSSTISDKAIQSRINAEIKIGNLNIPTPATTYAVHLPPGLKITHNGVECPPIYQLPFTSGSFIAVISDCNPTASANKEPLLPALQHQVDLDFDRLNQPRLVGWTFNRGALEIADVCGEQLGKTFVDGIGLFVSKLWSSKDYGCVA